MDAHTHGTTPAAVAQVPPRPFHEAAFSAAKRWGVINQPGARAEMFDRKAKDNAARYENNIESYIGTINIPVGLTGPLRIHGSYQAFLTEGSRTSRISSQMLSTAHTGTTPWGRYTRER